jgi:hypothetical protein
MQKMAMQVSADHYVADMDHIPFGVLSHGRLRMEEITESLDITSLKLQEALDHEF